MTREVPQVRAMKLVLLVSSVASLLLLAGAAYQENFRGQWRAHQRAYQALLVRTAADDNARRVARRFTIKQQQVYLKELGRIDRCTTCHLGIENPAAAGAPAPLTLHPRFGRNGLTDHPPDKFGCTICHQGEGRAVTKASAHGWRDDGTAVPHVRAPLLRGKEVYTSCGRCHYEVDLYGGQADLFAGASPGDAVSQRRGAGALIEQTAIDLTLPGAEPLATGKRLVVRLGCLGCHKYRGAGGVLGPDLTYVGDKTRHDFDFSHVTGEHTVSRWLYEHFMVPGEVSPGTLMPDLGLTPDQAHDLSRYMMSLHRKSAPASHTPRALGGTHLSVAPASGDTLFRMFCSACHGAEGFGSTMRAGIWPTGAAPWAQEWEAQDVVVARRGGGADGGGEARAGGGADGGVEARAGGGQRREPVRWTIMVPSLNHPDTLAVASDDYLRRIITTGRSGTNMLAWGLTGGLSPGQIDDLVRYIRGWQGSGPPPDSIRADRGDARRGGALYRSRCMGCHGSKGQGGIGVALNSASWLAIASDEFMRDAIVHGRANTAMPSWKQLSADEVSDLLAFIRHWQSPPPDKRVVLAKLSGATGPPNRRALRIGRALYRGKCATCHGRSGEGAIGPSLNTDEFLSIVDDGYLYDAIVLGRPGTAMPSWKHLSADDVVDLINALRHWNKRKRRKLSAADAGPWVAHGDPDRGRMIFGQVCAACHGAHAEGGTGPQLNNPVFLASANDAMLREWISYGKQGTPMLPFLKGRHGLVELSAGEIEDVVTFLRRFEVRVTRVAARPGMGIVSLGAETYAAACASCHGHNGEGATGSALSNADFLRSASDGYLQATIVLGRDGTEMLPMGKGSQGNVELSAEDIGNVVAFIRSWERDPPVRGIPARYVNGADVEAGQVLFSAYCAGCHGQQGRDGWAPALNNREFLAAATDGFLQATIVRGRAGTAMRSFGRGGGGVAELSRDQINNIVAYIRTWAGPEHRPTSSPEGAGDATVARLGDVDSAKVR